MREFIRRRMSRGVMFTLMQLRNELTCMRRHRQSARRAAQLTASGPIRLNLASGNHPKPGWVNVDLFMPGADLRLDLREPFPFPDQSASYIYCEHFFEHLDYPNVHESMGFVLERPGLPSEAVGFLRECRRVLQPGGTLDLVVPDAEGLIAEYVERHRTPFRFEKWWGPKWCDTTMHCVNYLFRQGREHKYAYDYETLHSVLASVRFADIVRREFDPAMDAPDHQIGSLCVIARKPADALVSAGGVAPPAYPPASPPAAPHTSPAG